MLHHKARTKSPWLFDVKGVPSVLRRAEGTAEDLGGLEGSERNESMPQHMSDLPAFNAEKASSQFFCQVCLGNMKPARNADGWQIGSWSRVLLTKA